MCIQINQKELNKTFIMISKQSLWSPRFCLYSALQGLMVGQRPRWCANIKATLVNNSLQLSKQFLQRAYNSACLLFSYCFFPFTVTCFEMWSFWGDHTAWLKVLYSLKPRAEKNAPRNWTAKTTHWNNVGLMRGQRRRRCANIKQHCFIVSCLLGALLWYTWQCGRTIYPTTRPRDSLPHFPALGVEGGGGHVGDTISIKGLELKKIMVDNNSFMPLLCTCVHTS